MAKLVTELGFIIAIPLVAFVFGGQWLDRLAGTKVVFTLGGVLLALLLSTYAIYLKIKKVSQQ
ncbi:MAG: AtpZ/AtpI family protein [Patescibacteria group bacterium]